MAKSPRAKDPSDEDEDAIMERTKEALRRALTTPHETNKEMVARRRGKASPRKQIKKRETS